MRKKEIKTPDYNRKAIDKYRARFDVVSVRLPLGAVDRMTACGFTPSDRVAAIMAALEKKEAEKGIIPSVITEKD